jgi:hypothetical protein
MTYRSFVLGISSVAVLCAGCAATGDEAPALSVGEGRVAGAVFADLNGNGIRDTAEPGIAEVAVSNGLDVVLTDRHGRYALDVHEGEPVFVVKPAGWAVAHDPVTHLPRHFFLDPLGRGGAVDFPLTEQDESREFTMIALGDTQPRDQTQVDKVSHDVVEELVGVEAAIGVTHGDQVFDDLSMLPQIAGSIGVLRRPWHHVIGNHDIDRGAEDQLSVDASYERVFGPATYAFDYAGVHFIVFNDVMWELGENSYHGELGPRRLAFIENDLAHVSADKLVVLMMHIPLADVRDRDELFRLLEPFPHTLSLAAHWHRQDHFYLDTGVAGAPPHHHIVMGTACGSWWGGGLDERGIPNALMSDGTPNGYSLVRFDGNRYSVRYYAAGRPAAYQMNVYAPEAIPAGVSTETEVVANFFAGSERCSLELRVGDGDWQAMERYEGDDPGLLAMKARERAFAERVANAADSPPVEAGLVDEQIDQILANYQDVQGRALPDSRPPKHMWRASLNGPLDEGYHLLEVRATDQFGQVHFGRRVIRAVSAQSPRE